MTVFIASIIPGPSMLLALDHGARYGLKKSFATAAGNVFATLIQALLALAGLGALLITFKKLFIFIKIAGALYLIYLGIRLFFEKKAKLSINTAARDIDKNFLGLFVEAFLLTIGNPKAILFFTALFPQFVNFSEQSFSDILIILSILLLIAFICMLIYSILGAVIRSIGNKKTFSSAFNKIFGITFIGLGLGLLFNKNK